ncbi:hypothetical protein KSP39_PZI021116 [Platanthera zijinensis]|uniref:Uncharacterized protein n=1 Tax=Platanthera zijinensis TaxID=2320716 RepID=A0AAP0AWX8_9ASPA
MKNLRSVFVISKIRWMLSLIMLIYKRDLNNYFSLKNCKGDELLGFCGKTPSIEDRQAGLGITLLRFSLLLTQVEVLPNSSYEQPSSHTRAASEPNPSYERVKTKPSDEAKSFKFQAAPASASPGAPPHPESASRYPKTASAKRNFNRPDHHRPTAAPSNGQKPRPDDAVRKTDSDPPERQRAKEDAHVPPPPPPSEALDAVSSSPEFPICFSLYSQPPDVLSQVKNPRAETQSASSGLSHLGEEKRLKRSSIRYRELRRLSRHREEESIPPHRTLTSSRVPNFAQVVFSGARHFSPPHPGSSSTFHGQDSSWICSQPSVMVNRSCAKNHNNNEHKVPRIPSAGASMKS